MTDPFRGEICAAWLEYLAEQDPEVLEHVMASVAGTCADTDVQQRTRDVYLTDLAYANNPSAQLTIHYPGASRCQS